MKLDNMTSVISLFQIANVLKNYEYTSIDAVKNH